MSAEAHADDHGHHGPAHYVKIWAILVVLLVISVIGPELGIQIVTLITAFGIAVVKAYIVAVYFMHIPADKKYITFLLLTTVFFVLLFFFAVAPDVMNHEGDQWVNTAAEAAVTRGIPGGHGEAGGAH